MEIQHADLDRELDRELDLVLGAMRLVASGGARRTIVAGLCSTSAVVALAAATADAIGVALEPLPRRDRPGFDIAIRRRPDGRTGFVR